MTTYAIADEVPDDCYYLTAGKEYPANEASAREFRIVSDWGGYLLCFWEDCSHLNGGNWRMVERDV